KFTAEIQYCEESDPCHVRLRSESGVSDHVQICEPSQTKGVAEASTTGALQIKQDFSGLGDRDAGVERQASRGRLLARRLKAVLARVLCGEARMLLMNDVDLARGPKARVVGV